MTVAISLWAGHDTATVDALTERVQAAADMGFPGVWVPQTAALDTLTALAVVADRVPDISVGSAVVPVQGRHPIALALQALTLADVAGPGRVTLGIGATHRPVSEGWFGIPYDDVVALTAETLEALAGLLSPARTSAVVGEHLTARITLGMQVPPPGLVVAALGPKMLDLAGRHSDGTVTWMTGPNALRRDVVPRLAAAAETAGRPAPRVIVGLPVCVTDDVPGARERLAPMMAGPVHMNSYRRMVEAEGIADPVDLVIMGDEATVEARIEDLGGAGATELLANVVGGRDERLRTLDLLALLARRSRR